jgi:hypothetical protein
LFAFDKEKPCRDCAIGRGKGVIAEIGTGSLGSSLLKIHPGETYNVQAGLW